MARFWGSFPHLWRLGLIAGLVLAGILAPFSVALGQLLKVQSDNFLKMDEELGDIRPGQTTYVYASDNATLLTMFFEEYRKDVSLVEISPYLVDAIIAAEDARFYTHNGVDPQGLARAFVANRKAGEVSQGGSTITMQYVRMALRDGAATPEDVIDATEQSNARKLREVRLAMTVEKRMSKQAILERYLNSAYFGHRAYGAFAAAKVYFSKDPKDLTLAEAALLAGLVKAPTDYDPASNDSTAAKDRRDYVLRTMGQLGFIDPDSAAAAQQDPLLLTVYEPQNDCQGVAPEINNYAYFCDFFRNWWMKQPEFGANPGERLDHLRRGGYRVVSSLDPNLQNMAMARVLEKEKVDSSFAHGVVVVEPGTGKVKAMAVNRVHSVDQSANGAHTAPGATAKGSYPNTVAPLLGGGNISGYQAGSTFKMFTMLAALEAGMPLTTAYNSPQQYVSQYVTEPGPGTCGNRWCPQNASGAMTGNQNMWSGFGKSVNTYFVQLEQAVGADKVVRMAERLGLTWHNDVDRYYADPVRSNGWGPFTLGVADTTPLEMANAYATVAAHGVYCEPMAVDQILDRDGKDIAKPKCRQEIPAQVANAATDAARCPTGYGAAGGSCGDWSTAGAVYKTVGRPVAGKTGTTDDTRAAWFVGYTPQLAGASFIADPDYPFHLVGDGQAWKPITTVSELLRDGSANLPVENFTYP